jgi:voltage-gated potassium channel
VTLPELRSRFNRFVDDHEIAWEVTMGALAVAFVVVGFAGDDAPDASRPLIEALDAGLTAIFVLEFGTRFVASYDRRRYLRGHWIDLVALVPTARGVRLLRLLRLLRLVRAFTGMYRALSHFERLAQHGRLVWLFVAWLGVAVISAAALYVAESGVNPAIDDPVDALWWGIVTLTTVGYGDVFPITPEGRLAGAALMILGITLFAAITGTLTSFLVASQGVSDESPAVRLRQLDELHRDGVVTDEEYAAKKAELLMRL